MKSPHATWRFPESNFGLFQDFNDNQTTHFARAPINHLVRETLQNSIDAREDGIETVEVSFSEMAVPTRILDIANYRNHLDSCVSIAESRGNERAAVDYQRALRAIEGEEIRTLRIQDAGTTGLSGQNWDALVSSQGSVHKNARSRVPGGSFGVGKNVVFLFSSIHAVIYSTRYANRHEGAVQKMIGRAQLMSHPKRNSRDHHQPSGWLDIERQPVSGRDIPASFRLNKPGTAVFILGWDPPSADWPSEIALRVAQNFFYAVHQRALRVSVTPYEAESITVDHKSLEDLLAVRDGYTQRFASYYRAIRDSDSLRTIGEDNSGSFDLHISANSGPNRTAVISRNGMFITDATSLDYNPFNIRHKSTWPDYAMVAMPATDSSDRWIRDMENPSHDSISPDQLKDRREQREADRIFASLRRDERALLDEIAGVIEPGTTTNVTELADLLPEAGEDTPSPDYEVTVATAKPARPPMGQPTNGEGVTDGTSDAETPGVRDVNFSETSKGEGQSSGGTSDPNPGDDPDHDAINAAETPSKPGTIKHHRIIAASAHSAHVFLTAANAAPIRIAVKPAGAEFRRESPMTITSIQAVNCPDLEVSAELPGDTFVITPTDETRIHLELTFQSSIDNLALKIA